MQNLNTGVYTKYSIDSFDDLWHTAAMKPRSFFFVVNCFQFVIWRSLTHPPGKFLYHVTCCELLSICDLTIFDTPTSRNNKWFNPLWIAFNLWFDDLWHTLLARHIALPSVVNCFQFVIWRSLTHPNQSAYSPSTCCELLSICDLTIFDTPRQLVRRNRYTLWIAFNLWFDDLWHTFIQITTRCISVVNCFQFVIWRSLTHRNAPPVPMPACCELLSICDLTIFDTP